MDYGPFTEELRRLFLNLLPLYIGEAGREIGTKIKLTDGTPITDLDRYTLDKIRGLIARYFPDDFTIGEEDQKSPDEIKRVLARRYQFQWSIDGLDGTGDLLSGLTSYGAAISRRYGDHILYASIFRPFDMRCRGNGFFWAERGKGAWEFFPDGNYRKLAVAPAGKLKRIVVMLEGKSVKQFRPPITYLGLAEKTYLGFSSCVAATSVARGQASAMVTTENKPWDNWPAILFIEEAGGIVTKHDGSPYSVDDCGNIVAAGNATDHARIVKLLNQQNNPIELKTERRNELKELKHPTLIVFCGLPSSGKTAIAEKVARTLNAEGAQISHFDIDEHVRTPNFGPPVRNDGTDPAIDSRDKDEMSGSYKILMGLIDGYLKARRSIMVTATFSSKKWGAGCLTRYLWPISICHSPYRMVQPKIDRRGASSSD